MLATGVKDPHMHFATAIFDMVAVIGGDQVAQGKPHPDIF